MTLDFQATSVDGARELLETTAETAYRKVADVWPNRELAWPYLEQVVRGIGETKLPEEDLKLIKEEYIKKYLPKSAHESSDKGQ